MAARAQAPHAWVTNPHREGPTMTSDTPTPSSDDPDSTTEPNQVLASELFTITVPATIAGLASVDPKIPTYVGD
jgi:hypothetical protein